MKLNTLYHMDCFEFLNELPNNSVDLAIADPPYNMSIAKWDRYKNETEYFNFTFQWIDQMLLKLKPSASFYLFNNAYNSAIILNYLVTKGLKYRNWIVWYKKDGFSPSKKKYVNNQETILFFTMSNQYTFNYDDIRIPYLSESRMIHAQSKGLLKNGKRWYPNPKGKMCTDVWEFSSHRHTTKVNGKIQKPLHPTIKPHELIARMISASSKEGDVVLDLFCGSASTSIVSKQMNRLFIGCDNNADYIALANQSLNTMQEG